MSGAAGLGVSEMDLTYSAAALIVQVFNVSRDGEIPTGPIPGLLGVGVPRWFRHSGLFLGLSILFCLISTVQLAEGRGSGNWVG